MHGFVDHRSMEMAAGGPVGPCEFSSITFNTRLCTGAQHKTVAESLMSSDGLQPLVQAQVQGSQPPAAPKNSGSLLDVWWMSKRLVTGAILDPGGCDRLAGHPQSRPRRRSARGLAVAYALMLRVRSEQFSFERTSLGSGVTDHSCAVITVREQLGNRLKRARQAASA